MLGIGSENFVRRAAAIFCSLFFCSLFFCNRFAVRSAGWNVAILTRPTGPRLQKRRERRIQPQNRLSQSETALSSAPYAESDRAQQNPESRLETIQDHGDGQGQASTCFAPPFAFLEERQAQTAHGEVSRSRQDRYVSDQVEHAVRLGRARKADCAAAIFREQFLSVRGYGLRTYEPRQSRNAATVV
ncbi:MAG: hypothetical protein QOF24_92 [Verrucomicrobiota bacterium]